MLYVQQFQQNRRNHRHEYQRLRSAADRNFLQAADAKKPVAVSRRRPTPSNLDRARTSALLILTRVPLTNELSTVDTRAHSWNPRQSRITRENRDSITALAKGLIRDDEKQFSNEQGEMFAAQWHQHLANSISRPMTAKASTRCTRAPPALVDPARMFRSTSIEISRPTTAPVTIEARPRRLNTAKTRSPALGRVPLTTAAPAVRPRAPACVESSDHFDNLSNSTLMHLTDGLKPSISKSDNHFVHELCSSTNEMLNTSRDSFLDASQATLSMDKSPSIDIAESDVRDNKLHDAPSASPHRKRACEDSIDIDLASDSFFDEYKSPFNEQCDNAISLQAYVQTNNEWSFKEFYRNARTPFAPGTNTKAVFEKCVKLARLQATTVRWEQRRRQTTAAYNRLVRAMAYENSLLSLNGTLPSKATTNERDAREFNDLKRELRCNECKRLTCLGNCAPGQDYHLFKRITSSWKQQSLTNVNTVTNAPTYRLRSSKAAYSSGQKPQRSPPDVRPRSMHHTARDPRFKYDQTSLSPVVVVPLLDDDSQPVAARQAPPRSSHGLLPGKSFRSQRRDSLTLIASSIKFVP